jgi:uncharacterized protein (DUF952 family)
MGAAPIYHISRREEWEAAQAAGRYSGSAQDAADGFIHFSTAAQVEESAARHRTGQSGLVPLAVDPEALGAALKWEPSRRGAWELPLGPDSRHVFPAPILEAGVLE